MNSEINVFGRLLLRSGLSRTRIESVLLRRPITGRGEYSVRKLYKRAVKECCFQSKLDTLRDLAVYVDSHICDDEDYDADLVIMVNLVGVKVDLRDTFPIDIALKLVPRLFRKGLLAMLPFFVQAISEVVPITHSLISTFLIEVTLLTSDDARRVTDGYEALFETIQILLNHRNENSEDIHLVLCSLFETFEDWNISQALSVEFVEEHFRFIVRLVELFLKQQVDADSFFTSSILQDAVSQIEDYERLVSTSEVYTDDIELEKMNAIINGLADVFRCFMLNRSHASNIIIDVEIEESYFLYRPDMMETAVIKLMEYSCKKGRSTRLIRLLLDAVSCADLIDFKKKLILNIEDTLATSSDDCNSQKIKALECLNEVELPRSLQHLSREAIHRALWNGKSSGAIQHATLSSLGLPECVADYCMHS